MTPVVFFSALAGRTDNFFLSNAYLQNYSIEFNQSNNKFHSYTGNVAYDGTANIRTRLGNTVEFAYYQVKGLATTWHVLGSGGYFNNVDPIHGIQSINISFKTDNASYSIYYSGDTSFNQHADFVSSSSTPISFNFNDYLPNYFKIVNNSGSNFNISSISLSLDCSNSHPYLSLTTNDSSMGTITGEGEKNANSEVTIQAVPEKGYKFIGWYDGDNLISDEANYSFIIGNDNLAYTGMFTYEKYNFIVKSKSSEQGTVDDLSGQYDYLSEITIKAYPLEGYSFSGWYNSTGVKISSNNPYTFTMPSWDLKYIARFSANSYDVSLCNLNPELGTISGAGTFLYKRSVTLTATPNVGVSFVGWYNKNDELVSADATYTFDMPHYDLEYNAKFEMTPFVVELSVNDEDMGSTSGSGSYIYQQNVTLNAYPTEHNSFAGWYDGDLLVSCDNPYTFDMPDYSLVYEAKFTKNYKIFVYSDDESMGTVTAPTEWGAGLEVTVKVNENPGYAIDYWYDDDLNELSYDSSYTFVMPNHDINLYVSLCQGYCLTLSSSDETKGTVSGAGQYKAGRSVTVILNRYSGVLKGWFDDLDNMVSTSENYTFEMPSKDYYLEARFMNQEEEDLWNWQVDHGVIPYFVNANQITYGLYPQTVVDDSNLALTLDELDSSHKYYDWYYYEGDYYKKIKVNLYRETSFTYFKNGQIVYPNDEFWFKCEAIVWDVLSVNNNEYTLISSVLLDTVTYQHISSTQTTSDGREIYPNNYQYSDIRAWINGNFYNTAFSLNKDYIQKTTVNNRIEGNPYACNDTNDYVFLISEKEARDYQLCDSIIEYTDWSLANGCQWSWGVCDYWTRTPYYYNSIYVYSILQWSNLESNTNETRIHYSRADINYMCVRPSITIKF